MRPIHLIHADKTRPAVILTRQTARPYLSGITVAPITSSVRELRSEVSVGPQNGLDHPSVIHCDTIQTIALDQIGKLIGHLTAEQEHELSAAIAHALELELPSSH